MIFPTRILISDRIFAKARPMTRRSRNHSAGGHSVQEHMAIDPAQRERDCTVVTDDCILAQRLEKPVKCLTSS
jgi:hypothetical protein